MKTTVILIGPLGAGKTTIGRLLAERLERPLCSVDTVRRIYYEQAGYDEGVAATIAASEQGIRGVLRYAEPFDAEMIERILADYLGSIIDLGASNSVYEDKDILARVEKALAPFPNVFLLLPSPDTAESAEILKARLIEKLTKERKSFSAKLFLLNDYFTRHRSNWQLAKRVVYTGGKTAEAVCNQIVARLDG